jgi:hypothetical protein
MTCGRGEGLGAQPLSPPLRPGNLPAFEAGETGDMMFLAVNKQCAHDQ